MAPIGLPKGPNRWGRLGTSAPNGRALTHELVERTAHRPIEVDDPNGAHGTEGCSTHQTYRQPWEKVDGDRAGTRKTTCRVNLDEPVGQDETHCPESQSQSEDDHGPPRPPAF